MTKDDMEDNLIFRYFEKRKIDVDRKGG